MSLKKRVGNIRAALREILHDLRDTLGIVGRCRSAIHGFLETRGGDQFHGPRDLADVANAFSAFIELSNIGHSRSEPWFA